MSTLPLCPKNVYAPPSSSHRFSTAPFLPLWLQRSEPKNLPPPTATPRAPPTVFAQAPSPSTGRVGVGYPCGPNSPSVPLCLTSVCCLLSVVCCLLLCPLPFALCPLPVSSVDRPVNRPSFPQTLRVLRARSGSNPIVSRPPSAILPRAPILTPGARCCCEVTPCPSAHTNQK